MTDKKKNFTEEFIGITYRSMSEGITYKSLGNSASIPQKAHPSEGDGSGKLHPWDICA